MTNNLDSLKNPRWLGQIDQGNSRIYHGEVPADLVYLKDHFPGFSLVPGVVELQWITEKIYEFLAQLQISSGDKLEISSFNKLKYQKFLLPQDSFVLQINWDETKQQMAFKLTTNNEPCCSGLAILKAMS